MNIVPLIPTPPQVSPVKPTVYIEYENLPVEATLQAHLIADHRFVAILDAGLDIYRCVQCGKQCAANSLMTVAIEGTHEFERCKGWFNYLEVCSIFAKDTKPSVVLAPKQDEADPVK